MKRTPFYDKHIELGAKIVEFAGFEMPIQYGSIVEEVKHVREKVGLFDVSHMGEIEITGPDRVKFANYITTNDVESLSINQVQYSLMCYEDGGIVDDLLVYRFEDRILLVVNAANLEKDFEWVVKNKKWDVKIENISDKIGQLAIQGPLAQQIVQRLTDINLDDIKFYWAKEGIVAGKQVIISRTGYTGEDGFEIYMNKEDGMDIWDALFEKGTEEELKPIGLGARDILRLEMKYMLYGNDIDKNTNPLEAGLSWAVKLNKDDFIGKDSLLKIKEEGLKRKLVCFEMIDRGIPRHEYNILNEEGENIGFVTSGSMSPSTGKNIGLGYVKKGFTKSGTKIKIEVRNRQLNAIIVKPPFYKNGSIKKGV